MSLGNMIREVRNNNNLTQEQFAQKFSVTRQTVSNWENEKNYPDLFTLKLISEEYGVSLDELFKEDEKYIASIDDTKRKMSTIKKVLAASVVILIAVIVGFFVTLHIAFQPTSDGMRINSDTTIRMLVDLPNATPSRAITYTTDKMRGESDYERTIRKFKRNAFGGVEGDIPCVKLDEGQKIVLRFQDLSYNNLSPDAITDVSAELTNVISSHDNTENTSMKYTVQNGSIIVDPSQVEYEKTDESGEIWYNMAITVQYKYEGKHYSSVTAVTVFDR